MLSLYRRDLGDPYRNRLPGVVWLHNLRDCLGNVRILLARNPCGRRRLKSLGPDIVNSRYQWKLALNIRIVIAFYHPRMPLFVSLSAVGLRTSGLGGVVVFQSSCSMVFGYPVRACALRLSYIRSLRRPFAGDVGCAHRPGFLRV